MAAFLKGIGDRRTSLTDADDSVIIWSSCGSGKNNNLYPHCNGRAGAPSISEGNRSRHGKSGEEEETGRQERDIDLFRPVAGLSCIRANATYSEG